MGITKKQLLESIRQIKEYVDNKGSISIDPTTKNWLIDNIDTGICSEGKEGKSIQSITKDENNNIIITFSDGTTQDIGQLNVDVQANFLTETGFGNLRYYNGHLQSYDVETSTWVDTSVTPDNIYIINMTPQEMKSIRGIYDIDLGHYKLKFEEPDDTIIENQVACVVEKVIIRRKLDSVPISENDGELVTEIGRKDFGTYKGIWYVDEALTPNKGEAWYYKAFPISTLGFSNTSTSNQTDGLVCKDYYLYGFRLDTTEESDPASMITYLEDNKYFSSVHMNYITDSFDSGDWGDSWFMKVKPCMLNYDGTVAYYLNPNDYTLKEDGTASDIADATFAGNAMIGIPKTYWKIVDNGDGTADFYFSNKAVDEDFHCWSHLDNNGEEIDYCYMPIYNGYSDGTRLRSLSGKTPMHTQTGTTEINLAKANNTDDNVIWYTEVYSDRTLINLLLLLIGKSTNTQAVFGNGYYTGGSQNSNPRIATGTMNTKGLFWGSNGSSMVGVKVFGMEHWWGNQWRRIAGWINNKGTQMIKLTYGQSDGSTVDGYNTDGSGYISIGCTPGGTSGGYVSKMTVTEHGLIPTTASGSATTYFTDGLWFNNSQVDYAFVGGSCNSGFLVGALYVALNSLVSIATWHVGAALSCKPLAQKG